MADSNSTQQTILHVDMDAFYVSIELLSRPDLVGKPVVVGGSPQSRGVVCSASYEARAFGIRSAMPCYKAYKLCPQAVFISNSFSHYSAYSRQLKAIFQRFSPLVEMASQDEAYLDLSGSERLQGSPLAVAETLRRTVLQETKLPCSIGIGRSKMVAKIASALCKPKGLLWVPAGNEGEFLGRLSVGKVPGVGKETKAQLYAYGIETIEELLGCSAEKFPAPLNRRLWELQQRCLGKKESPVVPYREAKSVSHERTFDSDVSSLDQLDNYLVWLADKVATRLREKNVQAKTIGIKLKYADFTSHTAEQSVFTPTDDALQMALIAKELLRKRWNGKAPLRLIGVYAAGFDAPSEQLELFAEEKPASEPRKTDGKIDRILDQVREKHGQNSLLRASGKIS